jgi:uncharacterized protein YlaI
MIDEVLMANSFPQSPYMKKNLIGYKVGEKGYVMAYVGRDNQRRAKWLVKCGLCYREFVTKTSLITGFKNRKPITMCQKCGERINIKPMLGKRFGRWLVIDVSDKRSHAKLSKKGSCFYKCICDCGTEKLVSGTTLRLGQTKSCGCYNRDHKRSLCGENSPNWKSELTYEDRINKKQLLYYKVFARPVFERDGYRCVICNIGGKLNAHHLDGFNWNIEKRDDPNNGVTLCLSCHNIFHSKEYFGRGNNTKNQFISFYKEKTGKDWI